jgi:O-antigen ligase
VIVFAIGYSLPKEILHSKWILSVVIGIITFNNIQVLGSYIDVLIANNWKLSLTEIASAPMKFGINTNFLGSMMLLYVPVLMELGKNRWRKYLCLGNVVFIVWLLPLFNSRAVTLALGMMVLFYLWRSLKDGKLIQSFAWVIGIAALIALTYQAVIVDKNNYIEKYSPVRTISEDTGDNRIHFWENSLKLFQEKPLLGHGAGNWQTEFFKFGSNQYSQGARTTHAHSLWFETLSELGLIGLLGILGLLSIIFWHWWRTENWSAIGLFLGLLALCSFYGIYQPRAGAFPSVILILFVWLGISTRDIEPLKFRLLGSILVVGLLGLSLYLTYSHYAFSRYLADVATTDKSERREKLKNWDNYGQPMFNGFRAGKSIDILRSNYYWGLGLKNESIATLEKSVVEDPHNWQAWKILGQRTSFVKRNKRAVGSYKNTLNLYNDVQSAVRLTELGLKLGNDSAYQQGIEFYYEEIEPALLGNYYDDYLISPNKRIATFWKNRCIAIDRFQEMMEEKQLRAK